MESIDSEFETEYQAWLEGHREGKRAEWFDHPVWGLARSKVCVVEPGASVDAHGIPAAVLSARQLMGFISETFPKEVLNAPPVGSGPIHTPEGA